MATLAAVAVGAPFLSPVTAHADDTRTCEPWYGYSVCFQQSDTTWWMCNPDCSQIPPPVRPFPGLPPAPPPGAPPPTPGPPPPPWPSPRPVFPGCEIINDCNNLSNPANWGPMWIPTLTF